MNLFWETKNKANSVVLDHAAPDKGLHCLGFQLHVTHY